MIVAKSDKIGKSYSQYLYLHDTIKDGTPASRTLRSKILTTDASDNPDDVFEVKLDSEDAYIVDKNGKEIDTGYTSKDLRRFFYCQIL